MKLHLMRLTCVLFSFLFLASQTASVSAGFIDITRPGDPIQLISGDNQGDTAAGPPPGAEGVENAINDTAQKYLNFLDLNSGFAVTPSGNPANDPVIGVRFYTANDAPERDPASFQLSGSDTGLDGPWSVIASGNLALPDDRNDEDPRPMIPPAGNLDLDHQEILFEDNTTAYAHYRVIFPTLKNAATANSMQIAEVELLAVPEPATMALVLAALLGIIGWMRTERC